MQQGLEVKNTHKKRPVAKAQSGVALSRLCLGKAQQQVAVVGILFLAQLDFAWQAFGDGIGKRIEFIEDGDNAGLHFFAWNGDCSLM